MCNMYVCVYYIFSNTRIYTTLRFVTKHQSKPLSLALPKSFSTISN